MSDLTIKLTNSSAIDIPHGDLTLNGIKISGSTISGSGGALNLGNGSLTLDNSMLQNNSAGGSGGSISIATGDLTMDNSTIQYSYAGVSGGAISIGTGQVSLGQTGSVTLASCTVSSISTDVAGGAIAIGTGTGLSLVDNTTISKCTAMSKSASGDGGAISIATGDLTMGYSTGDTISYCYATSDGSAIASTVSGNIELDNSTASKCYAHYGNGGAISVDSGTVSSTNTHYLECRANLYGGGISLATGEVSSEDNYFTGCEAYLDYSGHGGGIGVAKGSIDSEYDVFDHCNAGTEGGGIDLDLGSLTVNYGSITSCDAYGNGGGICVGQGTTFLYANTITDCMATEPLASFGGGICVNAATTVTPGYSFTTVLDEDQISGCLCFGNGAGIEVGGYGTFLMQNSSISGCKTNRHAMHDTDGEGGGIYINEGDSCKIESSVISGCYAIHAGGGVASDAEYCTISSSIISGNTAADSTYGDGTTGFGGGILLLNPTLSGDILVDSTVTGNYAGTNGAGIYSIYATISIVNSTISSNFAQDNGGGIYGLRAAIDITGCTLSGNTANTGSGGGIESNSFDVSVGDPALTILNSTIAFNSALNEGGGINIENLRNTVSISFATITGNSANVAGGGIDLESVQTGYAPTVNINATVISGNDSAEDMPVIWYEYDLNIPPVASQTVNFKYCAIPTSDYNIPVTLSTFTVNNTDGLSFSDNSDLYIGLLTDNGGPTENAGPTVLGSPTEVVGPTQTCLPQYDPSGMLPNSPLIDFIPNDAYSVTLDQRNQMRPFQILDNPDQALDIGAVEVTQVADVIVNGGDVQRSRLTTIEITFPQPVSAATLNSDGGIVLTRTTALSLPLDGTIVETGASGSNGIILLSATSGMVTDITLTFANADSSKSL